MLNKRVDLYLARMAVDLSQTALLVVDCQKGFEHPTHWGQTRSNPDFESNLTAFAGSVQVEDWGTLFCADHPYNPQVVDPRFTTVSRCTWCGFPPLRQAETRRDYNIQDGQLCLHRNRPGGTYPGRRDPEAVHSRVNNKYLPLP